MRSSQQSAFARGTLDNLKCQVRAYLLFCKAYNLSPFPASLDTVQCFIQFLSRTFASISSVRNYLSGVKLIHILSALPFPHLDSLEISLLLKGLSRLNPFIPRQALPITPDILLSIYRLLDLSSPLHATLWCAFLLAFFLFARKSNLVPPSNPKFSVHKHLCRRDIFIGQHNLLVYIKWSKTIQTGGRYLLIPLVAIPGSPFCPRRAYLHMLSLMPGAPEAPVFLVPSKQGPVSLTHSSFTRHLRKLLSRAGHNPARYSGHSFRRGGASFALSCGVSGELIRVHGDWKSQCYLRYLDMSVQQRQWVSGTMARVLSG